MSERERVSERDSVCVCERERFHRRWVEGLIKDMNEELDEAKLNAKVLL